MLGAAAVASRPSQEGRDLHISNIKCCQPNQNFNVARWPKANILALLIGSSHSTVALNTNSSWSQAGSKRHSAAYQKIMLHQINATRHTHASGCVMLGQCIDRLCGE